MRSNKNSSDLVVIKTIGKPIRVPAITIPCGGDSAERKAKICESNVALLDKYIEELDEKRFNLEVLLLGEDDKEASRILQSKINEVKLTLRRAGATRSEFVRMKLGFKV